MQIQIKYKLTPADMELLVSAINLYHINEFHLFLDIWYIRENMPKVTFNH